MHRRNTDATLFLRWRHATMMMIMMSHDDNSTPSRWVLFGRDWLCWNVSPNFKMNWRISDVVHPGAYAKSVQKVDEFIVFPCRSRSYVQQWVLRRQYHILRLDDLIDDWVGDSTVRFDGVEESHDGSSELGLPIFLASDINHLSISMCHSHITNWCSKFMSILVYRPSTWSVLENESVTSTLFFDEGSQIFDF